MIRKYHNHTLQNNLWHREKDPLSINSNKSPERKSKQSKKLSLPRQDFLLQGVHVSLRILKLLQLCLYSLKTYKTKRKQNTQTVAFPFFVVENNNAFN